MTHYLLIFFAGLAGSMHCIGMCGGFACAMGADSRGRVATLHRHLIYNLGRLTTYCFLGALVGHLGVLLVGHSGDNTVASVAQRSLAVLSGSLMVYIGLQFFGYFRRSGHPFVGLGGEFLTRALGDLLKAPRHGAPLAFGVLNGFLPCPLVYALAAQAAVSGGPLPGFLTMAAFGLGTFPAMLMMGGIGVWFRTDSGGSSVHRIQVDSLRGGGSLGMLRDWRQYGVRIAGGFIMLLGLVTFARGLLPMSAHMHGL